MSRAAIVAVVVFLFTFAAHPGSAASIPHAQLLKRVLASVEAALKFFTEDYSQINVDGLFGLRLGQGQLLEAIRECELRSCDETIVHKLRSLNRELGAACDAALPYVKDDDEVYYKRFLSSIDAPYLLAYTPTEFDDQRGPMRKVGSQRTYNEGRGDDCYVRILGTYEEDGKTFPKCNITHDCWEYMTKEDTSGYFITHQLLYFIMVEHVGCKDEVEKFMEGQSLYGVMKRMCDDIYNEARKLSSRGNVVFRHKDIFLEQTVLCGPLGFEDFLRPDWIDMVLGWPDKRLGCFRASLSSFDIEMVSSGRMPDTSKEDKLMMQENSGSYEPDKSGTMRKLLREKPMKDGCLAHTSGLGFGVLNTYLRFLLRYL